MKTEKTLKELAKALGEDKKIRVICEDENTIVLAFRKNQHPAEDYSFEMGI